MKRLEFAGIRKPPRPKMLEFPGFCDSQAEDAGIPNCTTRLETLEFVGFLWTICLKMLEFPRPPFCGPCCTLPNDAMCAKIAIGTWKRTTTCVGAQTRSRRFACHRPLPGWWSRGREVTCSKNSFMSLQSPTIINSRNFVFVCHLWAPTLRYLGAMVMTMLDPRPGKLTEHHPPKRSVTSRSTTPHKILDATQ